MWRGVTTARRGSIQGGGARPPPITRMLSWPFCHHPRHRSFYFPVKDVIDGDLCEQYPQLAADKQRAVSCGWLCGVQGCLQLGWRVREGGVGPL